MNIAVSKSRNARDLMPADVLPPQLVERVLAGLGINHRGEPTLDFLRQIYGAWCHRVPFDNTLKLIHVRSNNPADLPGNTAVSFLQSWLRFGTGGTCWSGANAFHLLLSSLRFVSSRGIGTMLAAPDLPPNHGTVVVSFENAGYLVDCSMLHGEPLLLDADSETCIAHPSWGVRCMNRGGRWHIRWRPLNRLDGFECRLERFDATLAEYQDAYAKTRGWSPFNYELTVRVNRSEDAIGIAQGHSVSLRSDGSVLKVPVAPGDRNRLLIETIGISEEIVSQLPQDVPTPPPPWSRTARQLTKNELAQAAK